MWIIHLDGGGNRIVDGIGLLGFIFKGLELVREGLGYNDVVTRGNCPNEVYCLGEIMEFLKACDKYMWIYFV